MSAARALMRWIDMTHSVRHFPLGKGRVLIVSVSRIPSGVFVALALETTSADLKKPSDVFDDHAHAIIGENYSTMAEAKRAATRFARVDQRAKKCACKAIALRPAKAKGRSKLR